MHFVNNVVCFTLLQGKFEVTMARTFSLPFTQLVSVNLVDKFETNLGNY